MDRVQLDAVIQECLSCAQDHGEAAGGLGRVGRECVTGAVESAFGDRDVTAVAAPWLKAHVDGLVVAWLPS